MSTPYNIMQSFIIMQQYLHTSLWSKKLSSKKKLSKNNNSSKIKMLSKRAFKYVSKFHQYDFCLGLFGFIVTQNLNYLAFQYFDIERHLTKIIPETCRAH